jgi:hypothetical protein
MVRPARLERATSGSAGQRSIQLSYGRTHCDDAAPHSLRAEHTLQSLSDGRGAIFSWYGTPGAT